MASGRRLSARLPSIAIQPPPTRSYPVATVALYDPNDTRATKLTVGIVPAEDADATDLRRWFSEGADIRNDAGVTEEVLAFIDAARA